MKVRVINQLSTVPVSEWNKLDTQNIPFLAREFLVGLEEHKCLEDQGWYPCHLIIEDYEIQGLLPLYLKTNSVGEFVFDWDWADAYQRNGMKYYPKLVSAIPFTPVTGPRILLNKKISDKNSVSLILIESLQELARQNQCSGAHLLFNNDLENDVLEQAGFLLRQGCQYYWYNRDYTSFDGFLQSLTSKRRKQIKHERRAVQESGITIEVLRGKEISDYHWEIYYPFYSSTFLRKWGEPRLTPEFFQYLGKSLPDSTLLFLARHDKEYIAGAFAMCNDNTLYGRHWGCVDEYYKFLHFELCYYQTMEFCIENSLKTLNAGAQGEHKIHRGFIPVSTWSNHWLSDPGFNHAIREYLSTESRYIDQYKISLEAHLAYKNSAPSS